MLKSLDFIFECSGMVRLYLNFIFRTIIFVVVRLEEGDEAKGVEFI